MANWDGLEREAERLYRSAGHDPAAGATPLALITSLLGPSALRWADGEWIRGGGALGQVRGEWRVYLSRSYPLRNLRFVALHELAHWAMPGATEDDCDALAACLLAPRAAFERAIAETVMARLTARTCSRLGAWFRCTHSFAAMRYAEVTAEPLALISADRVRVRGGWSSPAEPREIRELVSASRPGLRKARLRDDCTRVVLSGIT